MTDRRFRVHVRKTFGIEDCRAKKQFTPLRLMSAVGSSLVAHLRFHRHPDSEKRLPHESRVPQSRVVQNLDWTSLNASLFFPPFFNSAAKARLFDLLSRTEDGTRDLTLLHQRLGPFAHMKMDGEWEVDVVTHKPELIKEGNERVKLNKLKCDQPIPHGPDAQKALFLAYHMCNIEIDMFNIFRIGQRAGARTRIHEWTLWSVDKLLYHAVYVDAGKCTIHRSPEFYPEVLLIKFFAEFGLKGNCGNEDDKGNLLELMPSFKDEECEECSEDDKKCHHDIKAYKAFWTALYWSVDIRAPGLTWELLKAKHSSSSCASLAEWISQGTQASSYFLKRLLWGGYRHWNRAYIVHLMAQYPGDNFIELDSQFDHDLFSLISKADVMYDAMQCGDIKTVLRLKKNGMTIKKYHLAVAGEHIADPDRKAKFIKKAEKQLW
ncbi:hypothetical protein BDK51DRAFT_39177 [Blyttiomyces helicus]|uniref:Uncharacterized protein n=1 Tax=Blyttiomyces helicus TaxID=388810 RepID=A0A4P9W9M1_9FUNG|nr:hypothetical protein BDK51DRAFT_39177 [Blyttiomyces helicus]|eukprot:RKO87510.1 hypothetical protein BDK51DRAFT_39177 [Blyttiomyces helicus]